MAIASTAAEYWNSESEDGTSYIDMINDLLLPLTDAHTTTIGAEFRELAVLYTAPHDLPDSVGLIRSPNVTNCHMVGPVDSAGFRWSKC